jgi:hypothetical protein
MRIISILTFFIFTLNYVNANSEWEKLNLINGCHIFHTSGYVIKSLPGKFCQFYDDGNLIMATETSLKMMDKFQAIKWEIKGNLHHQLNKSTDGKRILAMGLKQVKTAFNKTMTADTFMVLSLDGKILHQGDSTDLIKQVELQPYSESELSHLNSFYEIPKLSSKRVLPEYLKEGNYILNSYRQGIYILSSDLKKVLHHFTIPTSLVHQVHDVQVLENGNIIYFNNVVLEKTEKNPYSSIEEYDLVEKRIVLQFTSNPKQFFYSVFCGGVQELDQDLILFSHMLTGTYIYSKKSNTIVASIVGTHYMHDRFFPSQQVKAVDLRKFLTHWTP